MTVPSTTLPSGEDLIVWPRHDKPSLSHWAALGDREVADGRGHMADMLVDYIAYRWYKEAAAHLLAAQDNGMGPIRGPVFYYDRSLDQCHDISDEWGGVIELHARDSALLGSMVPNDRPLREDGWFNGEQLRRGDVLLILPDSSISFRPKHVDDVAPARNSLLAIQARFTKEILTELGMQPEEIGYRHCRLSSETVAATGLAVDIDDPSHPRWEVMLDRILADEEFIAYYERDCREGYEDRHIIQHPFSHRVVNRKTAITVMKAELDRMMDWISRGYQTEPHHIRERACFRRFIAEQDIAEEVGYFEGMFEPSTPVGKITSVGRIAPAQAWIDKD